MMHLVEVYVCVCVCVSVCLHENFKTIADICFLLGSNVHCRKISDDFACEGHRSRGHFQRVKEVYDFLLGVVIFHLRWLHFLVIIITYYYWPTITTIIISGK